MNWWPLNLRDEAKMEGYLYFDQHIRGLPKNPDGSINEFAHGFADNDVDAFRHAYVSGVFTQEYGEKTANILGWLNELSSIGSPAGGSNMDLWNNCVGRKLGSKAKSRTANVNVLQTIISSVNAYAPWTCFPHYPASQQFFPANISLYT